MDDSPAIVIVRQSADDNDMVNVSADVPATPMPTQIQPSTVPFPVDGTSCADVSVPSPSVTEDAPMCSQTPDLTADNNVDDVSSSSSSSSDDENGLQSEEVPDGLVDTQPQPTIELTASTLIIASEVPPESVCPRDETLSVSDETLTKHERRESVFDESAFQTREMRDLQKQSVHLAPAAVLSVDPSESETLRYPEECVSPSVDQPSSESKRFHSASASTSSDATESVAASDDSALAGNFVMPSVTSLTMSMEEEQALAMQRIYSPLRGLEDEWLQAAENADNAQNIDERFSVFVGTWNMYGREAPWSLSPFIVPGSHDIYAIGTQECERSIEKSITNSSKAKWEARLAAAFGDRYTLVATETMMAIHIAIFVRTGLMKHVKHVETSQIATGLLNGRVGNKGAVGVSFRLGCTRLLFLSAHFAAHQTKVEERNSDFARIAQFFRVHDRSLYDQVFWCGDFNYRINGNRRVVDALLARRFYEVLLANDQLRQERMKKQAFTHFCEGMLEFRPTYKFDVVSHTDRYDTSKKRRVPAWTDRVLWRASRHIVLEKYGSCEKMRYSDHKPVYAHFLVGIQLQAHSGDHEQMPKGKSRTCAVM
jgi:hypothetical protein